MRNPTHDEIIEWIELGSGNHDQKAIPSREPTDQDAAEFLDLIFKSMSVPEYFLRAPRNLPWDGFPLGGPDE